MNKQFLQRQRMERATQSMISSGLCVTSIVYSGHVKERKHAHGRALFCLLLRGILSEHYCNRTITFQPGVVGFHPSDAEHATEVLGNGTHVFVIDIGTEWLKRLDEYSWTPKTIYDLHQGEMSWYAKKMFHAWNHDEEIASELQMEGLVLQLLSCLVQNDIKRSRIPGWLPKVVDLLRNNFHHSITIQCISKEFGIHPVQLSRVFQRCMKQSLPEYITQLRVEFASEQLRSTSKDLTEIALDAGFSDQSHLTRIFKRWIGTTPALYRRANRVPPGIHAVS